MTEAIQSVVAELPGWVITEVHKTLARHRHGRNYKRMHPVYFLQRLQTGRKSERRLPARNPGVLAVPIRANQCWSIEFTSNMLGDGRAFGTFYTLEDFNRELLPIEIDLNLLAARGIRVLDRIAEQKSYPIKIRCNNGLELAPLELLPWAENHGIRLDIIYVRQSAQNSYIERFNRTYRGEILNLRPLSSLSEVRNLIKARMAKYNEQRPRDSLGDLDSVEYLAPATNGKL